MVTGETKNTSLRVKPGPNDLNCRQAVVTGPVGVGVLLGEGCPNDLNCRQAVVTVRPPGMLTTQRPCPNDLNCRQAVVTGRLAHGEQRGRGVVLTTSIADRQW